MKKNCRILILLTFMVLALFALSACSNRATEGLEFESLEDGTYIVLSYDGESSNVTIPAKYKGIEVTAIAEEAFEKSDIQSISIGKNVVVIGEEAFKDCYMLKSVDIKGNIEELSAYVFSGCKKLEKIDISRGVGEKIPSGLFEDCKSLKKIAIPDGVEQIEYNAFARCSSLKSVTLPKSLETIGDGAFFECAELTKINLPNKLKRIGIGAFSGCSSLESVTLPENLESIEGGAFSGCKSISKITIPDTVTYVGTNAFEAKITVTVNGSIINWSSGWNGGSKNVIYANSNNRKPTIEIKEGIYYCSHNILGLADRLYINDEEIVWTMILLGEKTSEHKYTYRIENNIIVCIPDVANGIIIGMTYNENENSIEFEYNDVTHIFYLEES